MWKLIFSPLCVIWTSFWFKLYIKEIKITSLSFCAKTCFQHHLVVSLTSPNALVEMKSPPPSVNVLHVLCVGHHHKNRTPSALLLPSVVDALPLTFSSSSLLSRMKRTQHGTDNNACFFRDACRGIWSPFGVFSSANIVSESEACDVMLAVRTKLQFNIFEVAWFDLVSSLAFVRCVKMIMLEGYLVFVSYFCKRKPSNEKYFCTRLINILTFFFKKKKSQRQDNHK